MLPTVGHARLVRCDFAPSDRTRVVRPTSAHFFSPPTLHHHRSLEQGHIKNAIFPNTYIYLSPALLNNANMGLTVTRRHLPPASLLSSRGIYISHIPTPSTTTSSGFLARPRPPHICCLRWRQRGVVAASRTTPSTVRSRTGRPLCVPLRFYFVLDFVNTKLHFEKR